MGLEGRVGDSRTEGGHVNLRLDADVLRFFKSQGKGYQTRINAVLRSYVDAQKAPKPKRTRHKQP